MGVEVVIRRQDAGADELLLKGRDVVEEVLRGAAAYVVDGVWWDREAVGPFCFSGAPPMTRMMPSTMSPMSGLSAMSPRMKPQRDVEDCAFSIFM